MTTRLPVSVFIIARNEADRIGRTIAAVGDLADEVIVVDSGSDDATVAIARELGATTFENEWPGYGLQKRFAEEKCRNDWVLNLDADEEASPELRAELHALFARGEPACDAYTIPIVEVLPFEDRPRAGAYTLAPVRLYRKSRGRYAPSPVHDRVELAPDARVGALRGIVRHRSLRSLGDAVRKLNDYSELQAADLLARGRRVRAWRVVAEFPGAFVKAYFGRGYFRRGAYGWILAVNYAFARHLRVAKAFERRHQGKQEDTGRPDAR